MAIPEQNLPPAILEVPVVPRPASRLPLIASLVPSVAAAIGLFFWALLSEFGRENLPWLLFFAAAFGSLLGILLFLFLNQSSAPGVLRIEPEQIRWQSTVGPGETALSYGDLWTAGKTGRGEAEVLGFSARDGRSIQVSTCFLPEPRTADEVLDRVRERVALLPDGPQRLAGIEERGRAAATRRFRFSNPVTAAAVGLLGLVFLAELAAEAFSDPVALWRLGANSYPLVKNGELFRLATASLLHGSGMHLFFNVMALTSLGSLLEPVLGGARYLTLLLASALAGAAASAFLGHSLLSLGASTGIAGLLAAYVLLLWRRPEQLGIPATRGTWLWLAASLLLPALLYDNVDHLAHLGGFLAGFALTLPAVYKREPAPAELASRHRPLFRAAAAVLAALFLIAGGIVIRRAFDPAQRNRIASDLLREESSLPPEILNHLAREVAESTAPSRSDLERALRGAERAMASDPAQPAYRDTRATVLYRLGRFREAVETQHDLQWIERTAFHKSQLARFEWAHFRARGPLFLGKRPAALPRARLDSGAVFVEAGEAQLPPGTALHFLLSRGSKPAALLEVAIGSSKPWEDLRARLPRDLAAQNPDGIHLTLLDTRPERQAPGTTKRKVHTIVPEVAELP